MDGERTAARNAVTMLAMAAGAGVLLIVAFQGTPEVLDYTTGLVPWGIPLVTGALAVGVAELGIAPDFETTVLAKLLVGALVVLTAWTAAPVVQDVLRLTGQVPSPPSWWGIALRLLAVLASLAAIVPLALALRRRRG